MRASIVDPNLSLEGVASGHTATQRATVGIADVLAHPASAPALVSHGNLRALILHHRDARWGLDAYLALSNTDVFHVD